MICGFWNPPLRSVSFSLLFRLSLLLFFFLFLLSSGVVSPSSLLSPHLALCLGDMCPRDRRLTKGLRMATKMDPDATDLCYRFTNLCGRTPSWVGKSGRNITLLSRWSPTTQAQYESCCPVCLVQKVGEHCSRARQPPGTPLVIRIISSKLLG